MINFTREDGIELFILEKEEIDLLNSGELVMFPTMMLVKTNDMDFVISRMNEANKTMVGNSLFDIIKESQAREYSKSAAYTSEQRGTISILPKKGGFDS